MNFADREKILVEKQSVAKRAGLSSEQAGVIWTSNGINYQISSALQPKNKTELPSSDPANGPDLLILVFIRGVCQLSNNHICLGFWPFCWHINHVFFPKNLCKSKMTIYHQNKYFQLHTTKVHHTYIMKCTQNSFTPKHLNLASLSQF